MDYIGKYFCKKKNLVIRGLNDQHAFLDFSGYNNIKLGDLIKFGDGDDDDGVKAMDFGINIGTTYFINEMILLQTSNLLFIYNNYDLLLFYF